MESVGQLAGRIAHDFNNLLTAILGFCELVLGDENTPHRSELEEIKHAGERAAALTRQLLAFSRKQVFHLEQLDLNAAVVNMETMPRRLIGEALAEAHAPCAPGRFVVLTVSDTGCGMDSGIR